MKALRIDNSCGYFLTEAGEHVPIDQITKDDLLRLVELVLSEEVEIDEYSEEGIQNKVHRIIYKSVFQKLSELAGRKKEFVDESERLFLEQYEQYCNATPEEEAS